MLFEFLCLKGGPFWMFTGGYSSMIAASILKSRAIHNFINITDGFDAVKESEVKVSEFVRPSSL